MSETGMGVLINMLGGNEEGVAAYTKALGEQIKWAGMKDDALFIHFENDLIVRFWDDGQSCCESRYMTTDDNPADFIGATFKGIRILEAENRDQDNHWGDHEVQFMIVDTSKGSFVFETHNEHNGYYGGFYVKCEEVRPL